MASTAYSGTVFAFWILLCINFMYFLMLPCDPQGVPVANKYQMGSNINILYHKHQELLEYQTFTAYLLKFHIFVNIGNFIGYPN